MSTLTITLPVPGARARWVAGGIAAGLLLAALIGPAPGPRTSLATDATDTREHTISVSGTGRVVITPDIADLRLGVQTEAATVKAARNANATAMTAVIASLKSLRIADADIQTTTLSLSPIYDDAPGSTRPRITGYRLSNAVAVTIRDLDIVGDAIDDALAAGATSLGGISFRASDQTGAERQAREAAMTEAKEKAETLASAAGVSISGVASISETSAPIPYPVYYASGLVEAADVATPVEAGTNEVQVTVAVVYVIN